MKENRGKIITAIAAAILLIIIVAAAVNKKSSTVRNIKDGIVRISCEDAIWLTDKYETLNKSALVEMEKEGYKNLSGDVLDKIKKSISNNNMEEKVQLEKWFKKVNKAMKKEFAEGHEAYGKLESYYLVIHSNATLKVLGVISEKEMYDNINRTFCTEVTQ